MADEPKNETAGALFESLAERQPRAACAAVHVTDKETFLDNNEQFDQNSLGESEYQGGEFMSQLSLNYANDPNAAANQLVIRPPNGGYGWIIVIAAFFSNLIVDGIATCFTAFKPSYSQTFQSPDSVIALIGALLIAAYLLVGPFVGGLCNKFGSRPVVMVGSLLSGLAFVAAPFMPNVWMYIFAYGLIGGIGFGMIYLPAIVVVGYYFDTKRAMATGLAVSGSGVGSIVMPLVGQYCVDTFGWKVAVWILAAMIFSCALMALLYRELAPEPAKDVEMEPLRNGVDHQNGDVGSPKATGDERLRNALAHCEGDGDREAHADDTAEFNRSRTSSQTAAQRTRKATITSTNSGMNSQNDLSASRSQLNGGGLSKISVRSFAQSMSKLSRSGQSNLSLAMSGVDPAEFSKPLNRQDIFYAGSVTKLNEFKKEGDAQSYRASVVNIPAAVVGEVLAASNLNLNEGPGLGKFSGSRVSRLTGGLLNEDVDLVDDTKCKWLPMGVRTTLSQMIDLELMKDPVMFLLCISNFLGMMGFYIPYVYLQDLAESKGVPKEQAVLLVPILGVLNTIGRVVCGWLADRKFVSSLAINNFSLVSCGFLCFLAPFCTTYTLLIVYSSVFGLIISAYICLTSIVLADLLGIENLTNSFGLLVVYRGFACLCGTPFAGLAYDVSKSYDVCFYLGGLVILIAGLVSCAVPYFDNKRRSKGLNEGDYLKEPIEFQDNMSGKLSVLTERSEEALTDYQRTIQSLRQQHALLQDVERERRKCSKPLVNEVHEETDDPDQDQKSNA
ncbi:unnamed protein product, partial [Mesorhabditis spiculigera]